MKLIKNYACHTAQLWIILNPAGQHPFGHHLNPGSSRHPALKTDCVANRLPHLLTQQARHIAGSRRSSNPERFKHNDTACFRRDDFEKL